MLAQLNEELTKKYIIVTNGVLRIKKKLKLNQEKQHEKTN